MKNEEEIQRELEIVVKKLEKLRGFL